MKTIEVVILVSTITCLKTLLILNVLQKLQLIPKIKIESVLSPEELLKDKKENPFPKLYRLIEQLSPFGPGNMRPVLS